MTIQELIQKDNTFSESGFLAKVDNTYIMILTSIMTENLKRVDHKVGNELYQQLTEKLNKLQSQNEIQMYDELNVKDSSIISIEDKDTYYEIKVNLISRYMDYKIDKTTREYKSGNNQSRIEKSHILTFRKKKNANREGISRKCPGCGASINANSTGICQYCGTIYNTEDYDWVLQDMKTS